MNIPFHLITPLPDNTTFDKVAEGLIITSKNISLGLRTQPSRFYRHGWQSWSLAAWTDLKPLPIQKPSILHPMQTDPVYSTEKRPHSSWIAAVEFEDGRILLLGSLGLDAHVFLNDKQLEGIYEAGKGEWFIGYGDERNVFSKYTNELTKRFGKKTKKPAPRVWCSWYSLYTAIDEKILSNAFDGLADLPFDVLQIDDGWQIKIGDWEANSKFPSGMKALAEQIKSTRRKAGLWLAPLIAVKSSTLFREHPDWFLRDERGRLVSAGFNWSEPLYALDTTHPAVLEWLAQLMKKVRTWGFDYLKLDFLYAGALPGKRCQEMPRESAYRKGLQVLREAMGADAFFLTCGAPIIPSMGLCDAIRVSTDVAAKWEDRSEVVFLQNYAIPSTRNAIRTSLHRQWLDPLFHLDPDVTYFRTQECALTTEQKSLLQNLALICGFKATSDLPQWLIADEREKLRAFLERKPKINQISRYVFQIDKEIVDFSPVMPLPPEPKGMEAIEAAVFGWLANHDWALKINDQMGKAALKKMKKSL